MMRSSFTRCAASPSRLTRAALRHRRALLALGEESSNTHRSSRSRSFFSFAAPQSLVKSHEETKVVPFSPEAMFDVVADVDQYKAFLPFCVESRVLRRPNDNVMEAVLRIGFKVFTESYTSRVIMKRPEKIVIKSIESPTFKRIESEWSFRRLPNPDTCEVHFKVTFEVASFLQANAIQLFFDDVARTQLKAFIGRTAKLQQAKKLQDSSQPNTSNQTATVFDAEDAVLPATTSAHPAAGFLTDLTWARDYDHVRDVFARTAVDGEKLYFAGFVEACSALGALSEDLRYISVNAALAGAIFSSFEISSSGKDWLNLDEFAVGVYLMTKGTIEEKAFSLFQVIDRSGDGRISREDLTRAMQRRIRTVKKIFPKLLADQVKLQMASEKVTTLAMSADEAMAHGMSVMESLMEEVERDIPLAVNQIFQEADLDQDDFITKDEWLFAWQTHPELVELMTIDGLKKVAQWASVVVADGSDDDDGKQGDTRLTFVD